MTWAVWLTVGAYRQDSNLWPLPLIFLSIVGLRFHRADVSRSPGVAPLAGLGSEWKRTSSRGRRSARLTRVTSCAVTLTLLVLDTESCSRTTAPATAAVQFKYVNPLCAGTMITFEFSIDHRVVGTARFRDGQTSPAYATSPGAHVLSATIPTLGRGFLADTTVVLAEGQTVTREMFVYCS